MLEYSLVLLQGDEEIVCVQAKKEEMSTLKEIVTTFNNLIEPRQTAQFTGIIINSGEILYDIILVDYEVSLLKIIYEGWNNICLNTG